MTKRKDDALTVDQLTLGHLRRLGDEIAREIADNISLDTYDLEREIRDLRALVDEMFEAWLGPEDTGEVAERRLADSERLERFARSYLDSREPDGTPPTQARLAEVLDVSDRWVRKVGWERIRARAAEIEEGDDRNV